MPTSTELKLIRGSDAQFSSLQKSADENNISRFFLLPVVRDVRSLERVNDFYHQESLKDPRAVLCGTIFPAHPGARQTLAELKSRGTKLIKLHSFLQRFDILGDPAMELFKALIEANLPVLFDTARIRQEHLKPGESLNFLTEPDKLLKLHSLLPDLKMIAAHGGGVLISDRERKALIGSGIHIDISTSFNTCDWPADNYDKSIENLVYLLNNHNQNRIFFGSDSPWRVQKQEIKELKQLCLKGKITKDQMENIFWKNANRFFDLGLA